MQPSHCGLQLALRTGARQADAMDMLIDIDAVGAHPHGIGEVQRHFGELPREHRRQRQALRDMTLDVGDEVAAIALRQLQQVHCADVHRRGGCFQMQKQCVEPRQRLQLVAPRGFWFSAW
jgi:hypothetical protein